MGNSMNRIFILFFLLLFSFSSCKVVPFFIPKEKRNEREKKRIERLEKKRKKAQYKLDIAKGAGKRKIKKLEKIESKLPGDSIVGWFRFRLFS